MLNPRLHFCTTLLLKNKYCQNGTFNPTALPFIPRWELLTSDSSSVKFPTMSLQSDTKSSRWSWRHSSSYQNRWSNIRSEHPRSQSRPGILQHTGSCPSFGSHEAPLMLFELVLLCFIGGGGMYVPRNG